MVKGIEHIMLPVAYRAAPADVAIIMVLVLIVFGPKRLPEVGQQLGQVMRELRDMTRRK